MRLGGNGAERVSKLRVHYLLGPTVFERSVPGGRGPRLLRLRERCDRDSTAPVRSRARCTGTPTRRTRRARPPSPVTRPRNTRHDFPNCAGSDLAATISPLTAAYTPTGSDTPALGPTEGGDPLGLWRRQLPLRCLESRVSPAARRRRSAQRPPRPAHGSRQTGPAQPATLRRPRSAAVAWPSAGAETAARWRSSVPRRCRSPPPAAAVTAGSRWAGRRS